LALRSRAAEVRILGPEGLADTADEIAQMAAQRGLGSTFDVTLFADASLAVERFEHTARRLRPVGQKGRKWLRRRASAPIPTEVHPDQ
jgi:hypothetical protein